MQALVFPSVKSSGQSSAPVSQIAGPHSSDWDSNIFYADLHLTNMSLCFTEAFRVSTQFMMSSVISVLGGVLLRPKVTFVEQVTYVL